MRRHRLLAWLQVLPALAAPITHSFSKRNEAGPLMDGQDFPDPSLIKVNNTWYAFATGNSDQSIHTQMGSSSDFISWTYMSGHDALPDLPEWVDKQSPAVWAPDINELDDGSFLIYFSAAAANNASQHCIGAAVSKSITGNFTPTSNDPLVCPEGDGGALDASGFKDPASGNRYLVYKIDGNSEGSGGVCNNGVAPIVSTPIILQQVGLDGVSFIGQPVIILTNELEDGPLVEAPSLVHSNGEYILFFSSNCYSTPQYDVSFATASSITGPYSRSGPLFTTGADGLQSPGGADIDPDGTHMVFHAYSQFGSAEVRPLFTATVSAKGNQVAVQ